MPTWRSTLIVMLFNCEFNIIQLQAAVPPTRFFSNDADQIFNRKDKMIYYETQY